MSDAPVHAMVRLRKLIGFAEGLRVAAGGASLLSLADERRRVERQIRSLEDELDAGGYAIIRTADDARRADRFEPELRRAIDEKRRRLADIDAAMVADRARSARVEPHALFASSFARALCTAAEYEYPAGGGGIAPARVLVAGDVERARLDAIGVDIERLRAELAATRSARLPPAEVRARIVADLTSFVRHERPHVLIERYARVDADRPAGRGLFVDTDVSDRQRSAIAIAIEGVEAYADRILTAVQGLASYTPGPPRAERDARTRTLADEIAALALEEERAALAIEDAHEDWLVIRRPVTELDPAAIWRVWCEWPPTAAATSSPDTERSAPTGRVSALGTASTRR